MHVLHSADDYWSHYADAGHAQKKELLTYNPILQTEFQAQLANQYHYDCRGPNNAVKH